MMKALAMRNLSPTRRVTLIGLGIALYVALSLAVQVPFFENYYLCLGYAALVVYSYFWGPAAGALVGAAGCVLHCLAINGMRGMPGWTLGNLFCGLVLGLLLPRILKRPFTLPRVFVAALLMVVTMAIAMLGIKSLTEVILYAQPMWARMAKNVYAFVANSVMLLASIPLCGALSAIYGKTAREV